jgi:hypothetical protein
VSELCKDKTYLKKSIIRMQVAASNTLVILAFLFYKAFSIVSYYVYWKINYIDLIFLHYQIISDF